MPAEDAKKFLDHVDRDSNLQKKLRDVHSDVVSVAKEHGYHFTQQELHAHMRKRWGISKPPAYDDPDTTTVG